MIVFYDLQLIVLYYLHLVFNILDGFRELKMWNGGEFSKT